VEKLRRRHVGLGGSPDPTILIEKNPILMLMAPVHVEFRHWPMKNGLGPVELVSSRVDVISCDIMASFILFSE
jgi:hypothetical protein